MGKAQHPRGWTFWKGWNPSVFSFVQSVGQSRIRSVRGPGSGDAGWDSGVVGRCTHLSAGCRQVWLRCPELLWIPRGSDAENGGRGAEEGSERWGWGGPGESSVLPEFRGPCCRLMSWQLCVTGVSLSPEQRGLAVGPGSAERQPLPRSLPPNPACSGVCVAASSSSLGFTLSAGSIGARPALSAGLVEKNSSQGPTVST